MEGVFFLGKKNTYIKLNYVIFYIVAIDFLVPSSKLKFTRFETKFGKKTSPQIATIINSHRGWEEFVPKFMLGFLDKIPTTM